MKNLHLNLLLVLALVSVSTSINASSFIVQSSPPSIEQDSSKSLWHINLSGTLHTNSGGNFAPYAQFDLNKATYASLGLLIGLRESPDMPSDFRPFLGNGHDSYLLGTATLGWHLPSNVKDVGFSIEGGLALGKLNEVHFTRNPPPEPSWFDFLADRYDVDHKSVNVVGLHTKFKVAWNIDEFIGFETALTAVMGAKVSFIGLQVGMNIGQLW